MTSPAPSCQDSVSAATLFSFGGRCEDSLGGSARRQPAAQQERPLPPKARASRG